MAGLGELAHNLEPNRIDGEEAAWAFEELETFPVSVPRSGLRPRELKAKLSARE